MYKLFFALLVFLRLNPCIALEDSYPVLEEELDCISVKHNEFGGSELFFWTMVQGEWTCLDYTWVDHKSMTVSYDQRHQKWVLIWNDGSDKAYRVLRTDHWIESYEPFDVEAQRWMQQLPRPGLKQRPSD